MSDFITLSCPNCASRLRVVPESASLVCPSCGNEYLVRHDAGGVLLESYARCPRCGRNDQVRIVSAMVREQTALASQLTSPEEPDTGRRPNIGIVTVTLFVSTLIFAYLFVVLLSTTSKTNNLGFAFVIPLLMSIFFGFLFGVERRSARALALRQQELRARWERAMARWQELYYCARDDRVFIPGEHQAVPVAQMHDLLYR